jgi:CDP-4-dehydro-6-deoxyglucose reductase
MPLPPPFDGRLVRARSLTPNVRELVFERLDGRPMEFLPGQWVNALLPIELDVAPDGAPPAPPARAQDLALKRSYSLASAPDGSSRFEIAVTRVQGGPGSTWLHSLEPGAVLPFSGPQGFFTRPVAGGPPALMVATGTGITPMRSMMRASIAAGARSPMWLLLGVRHEEDVLYADELKAMARDHDFVRFEPTLSQPRDDWRGRRGYVQAHLRELWTELEREPAGKPHAPHAYVCGLERMVSSVRGLLRGSMGLPRAQVHVERYD